MPPVALGVIEIAAPVWKLPFATAQSSAGGGATVIESVKLHVTDVSPSLTVTTTVWSPVDVLDPENAPVLEEIETPLGSPVAE